jgi:transcriptional regulator with XRE-family HTH domain
MKKKTISSPEDLGLLIRAVRKSTNVRQDDLSAVAGVSRQFAIDVERGKPTAQFGRVLLLLKELGITLTVDIPDEAAETLEKLRTNRSTETSGRSARRATKDK